MDEALASLKNAVHLGEVTKVSEIIASLENVVKDKMSANVFNKTLYDAVKQGRFEIIKILVQNGADVNYSDCLKQSLLCVALNRNYKDSDEIIKFLISNGSDINQTNVSGQSNFMFLMASDKLSLNYLIELLSSVKNIQEIELRTGGSFLHLVHRRHGDTHKVDMLQKLIERGLSINAGDNNDDTPLHVTATSACYEALKFLIENGANVHARNRMGETVLHNLSGSNELEGFTKSLDLLLECGMDINDTDSHGQSIIHHALMSKDTNTSAIERLISKGACVGITDIFGRNALFCAVENFNVFDYEKNEDIDLRVEVIKFLSEAGVDINQADLEGVTPLHLAVRRNDLDILVTLIDLGANVQNKTKSGASPLHWACKYYNMAHVMIHTFMEKNIDLNIVDDYGSTPLHWAVWFRRVQVCQTLLQVGCDYLVKDIMGDIPTDLARKLQFTEFRCLLEGNQFEDLDFLELQEPVLECNDSDPLVACPLLCYIKKKDGRLNTQEYIQHLQKHSWPLNALINTVFSSKSKGFLYDIDDIEIIPVKINELMTQLVAEISQENSLFRCELKIAGSMLEGTKVKIPDEFDYIFAFCEFQESFHPNRSTADPEDYVKLKLLKDNERTRFRRYLTHDDYLDSKLLVRDFYRLVNNKVKLLLNNVEFKQFICTKYLDEILSSVSCLRIDYFGRSAKYLSLSIDVVPAMYFVGWIPVGCSEEACRLLRQIDSKPMFSVVIKTPDRVHVRDYTLYYRISYASMEQTIMRDVPLCYKKGYIVLKALAQSGYFPQVIDHDNNRSLKGFISSYHMKTCFLHEIDISGIKFTDISESPIDGFESMLEWANRILQRLEICVKEKCLPSYFNREHNLLGLAGFKGGIQEQDIYFQLLEVFQVILEMVKLNKDCPK